jgi:hypothetical protein
MKSHQFPSFQSAIDYCNSKGELKYYGREGPHDNYVKCVYTLTVGRTVYHLYVYDSGFLEVTDIRGVR